MPPRDTPVMPTKRFILKEASGAVRFVELVQTAGTVVIKKSRPERRRPLVSRMELGTTGAVAYLAEREALMLAKGGTAVEELPAANARPSPQTEAVVLPGIERSVATSVVRHLGRGRSRYAMREKLEWAAGRDWDLLLWSLVRCGRVHPERHSELLGLLSEAASEADADTVVDVLSRSDGHGTAADEAADELLRAAHHNDPERLRARLVELPSPLQQRARLVVAPGQEERLDELDDLYDTQR